MRTKILLTFGLLISFFWSQSSYGQVTSTNYWMKYDSATCRYDVYVIINAGLADNTAERTATNAQVSIVVPAASTFTVDESYYPKLLDGLGAPQGWELGNVVTSPPGWATKKFVSFRPNLNAGTARYRKSVAVANVTAGDTIKLFSLKKTTATVNCGNDIRLFYNPPAVAPQDVIDPTSSDLPGGENFFMGFTMGGPNQLYNANTSQGFAPTPTITDLSTTCSAGIEINLDAYTSTCQGPLTYQWSGPSSYTGTSQDVSIPTATAANNGQYQVIVSDGIGCKDTLSILALTKPNAGANLTICNGLSDTLVGTPSSFIVPNTTPAIVETGVWGAVTSPANPPNATLTPIGNGQVNVAFNNPAGGGALLYRFWYKLGDCYDTMNYTVNPTPIVSTTDPNRDLCVGEVAPANYLSPTTLGTWTSSNSSIISITNPGPVITGVAAGGPVTFTYTRTSTGCRNSLTGFKVNPNPVVSVPVVCVGSSVSATPSGGGTWVSATTAVATVTAGTSTINGISTGTSVLTYTETVTGCRSNTTVTVNPRPVITLTGPNTICVLDSTTLSANLSPGQWTSGNTGIATITPTGIVIGQNPGTTTFTYTYNVTGCISNPSAPVTVTPSPTISTPPAIQCIGQTFTMTSSSAGGQWFSDNTSVATIGLTSGVVITVGAGQTKFTFRDAGGCEVKSATLIVNPKPVVSVTPNDSVCINDQVRLVPDVVPSSTSWANVTGNGNTTGQIVNIGNQRWFRGNNAGVASLQYTDANGCKSDSLKIRVLPIPNVGISGNNPICVGENTQLFPSSGGNWISLNPSIANVSSSGFVIGLTPGDVNFRFTNSDFCSAVTPIPLTVNPKPITTYLGPQGGCVGDVSLIAPTSGGTWISEFPAIASINATTGAILAVSPGTTRFRFTDDATGCVSDWSAIYVVTVKPSVSKTVNTLCIGANTTLNSFGAVGTWSSSDTAIAKVNNQGLVTGVSAGSVSFTFREAGLGCPSDPLTLTILDRPTISITGPTSICYGGGNNTSQLSPTTGGSWRSTNTAVATVNPTTGLVTANATTGIAKFIFTTDDGCESLESDPITVNIPTPSSIPAGPFCIGDTVVLFPASGGTWTSSNDGIATVISGSQIRTITNGSVTFTFTDAATGCISPPTSPMLVNEKPPITFTATSVCVGTSVQLAPTTGGTWTSTNATTATINNSGLATAQAPGTATFIFQNASTGCFSDPSATLTVTAGPTIAAALDPNLCIGETTTIATVPASVPGSWSVHSSSPVGSLTITAGGIITANSQGQARFVFTDAGGCKSLPSGVVTVEQKPVITGVSADICIGNTFQLQPTDGSYISTNPAVADVTAGGLVTGLTSGVAKFIFTHGTTGCVSDISDSVRVGASVDVGFSGPEVVCVGGTTQLFPNNGGTWVSNNPSVATVLPSGLVTTTSAGFATFTFTAQGCASSSTTDTLSVINCSNPDFNATFVNVPVPGDVSTNDPGGATTVYGTTPFLRSKPSGSSPNITMNPDGTYSFVSNIVGVYVYEVQNCSATVTVNCPISELTIYVTDYTEPNRRPVANTDFATTFINVNVTLPSLANDHCVVIAGCSLNPASVTIIDQPGNGVATVNLTNGDITYDPNPTFTGIDTLIYRVCVDGEPTNCATAKQFITVQSTTAVNSTVADDDFAVTMEETPVSGNVKLNDLDPEGNPTTVTPNTITVPAGTFTVAANGDFTFTPVKDFIGPVEFIYEICDNHPTATDVCVEATVHILVLPHLTIKVRVYLEGALMENSNGQALDGRPLMRDDLRSNKFSSRLGQRFIPNQDPYKFNHPDYDFANLYLNQAPVGIPAQPFYLTREARNLVHVIPTAVANKYLRYDSIPTYSSPNPVINPSTVFAVTGQNAIVDWVKVELRSKSSNTTKVITRSGLLQRDGDVVELDGYSGLEFPGIQVDSYYVVVSHRSHLGAMSKFAQSPKQLFELVNFTKDMPVFDFGTTPPTGYTSNPYDYTGLAQNNDVKPGYRALWAGNADNSRKIKSANPNDDINIVFGDVLYYPTNINLNANYDFAFGYMPGDFNLDGKSKFDNPDDDKNFVYGQVLFHILNAQFVANFDWVIEQVP